MFAAPTGRGPSWVLVLLWVSSQQIEPFCIWVSQPSQHIFLSLFLKKYTLLLVTDPPSSGVADSRRREHHAKAFQQERAARWPQARPRSSELRRQTLASRGHNSNPSHTPRRSHQGIRPLIVRPVSLRKPLTSALQEERSLDVGILLDSRLAV